MEEEGKMFESVFNNNVVGEDEESGWTMYFEEDDDGSLESLDLLSFGDEGVVDVVDDSMVSDASSGPPLPLPLHFDSPFEQVFSFKRRKVGNQHTISHTNETKHQQQDLLEDTASSPLCSSKSELTINAEWLADSRYSQSNDQIEMVKMRLDFLHSILPNAKPEASGQETLNVAVEYIAAMEQSIQAFEGLIAKSEEKGMEEGVLRKRGLCLVPISSVWDVL